MPWPKTVPDDVRRRLEAVLSYRNRPAPKDVWGAVLEWLEAGGAEATRECPETVTGPDKRLYQPFEPRPNLGTHEGLSFLQGMMRHEG